MKTYGYPVVSTFPNTPQLRDVVFNTSENSLYEFNGSYWVKLTTSSFARYQPSHTITLPLTSVGYGTFHTWGAHNPTPTSVTGSFPVGSTLKISGLVYSAPSLYTLFGDQGNTWPDVMGTGLAGEYVRGYAAGVFKLSANLSNLSSIQDSEVMCGVVFIGTPIGGVGRIIINGVVKRTIAVSQPVDRCRAYWETDIGQTPIAWLGGFAACAEYFEFDFNGQYEYIQSPTPDGSNSIDLLTFDTNNTKVAWHVDQVTGAGDEVLLPSAYIASQPPSMYTTAPPAPFSWGNLPIAVEASTFGQPDFGYYDNNQSPVKLNVNLGGYAASWTSADPGGQDPAYGIYYDLGYLNNNRSTTSLDGGYVIPAASIHNAAGAGDEYVPGQSGMFTVSTPTASSTYSITGQTSANPVLTAGLRQYPGIASSATWNQAYVQALNYSRPVIFEIWYSL